MRSNKPGELPVGHNCAQCSPDVRDFLGQAGVMDVLAAMLDADSW